MTTRAPAVLKNVAWAFLSAGGGPSSMPWKTNPKPFGSSRKSWKTTKRDEFFSASRRTGSDAMKRFAQLLIALDLLGKYRDATDDFGSFGSFMQISGWYWWLQYVDWMMMTEYRGECWHTLHNLIFSEGMAKCNTNRPRGYKLPNHMINFSNHDAL